MKALSPRSFFTATLMEHYAHPRNRGALKGAEIVTAADNPLCGDWVKLWVRLQRERDERKRIVYRIKRVSFQGEGCVLSVGTTSLLTEELPGKTLAEVLCWGRREIFRLLGVRIGPARESCALLALQALQRGGEDFLRRRAGGRRGK